MPLALIVDSIDSVPEALRTEYVEKDGKFHLVVEGLPDYEGAQKRIKALNDENAKRRLALDPWEKLGKSPADIEAMVEEARVKEEEALKKSGNVDEILKTHAGKAELVRKELETRLTGERDTALSVARKAIVDTRIGAALTKAKATAAGLDLLTERLSKRVDLSLADGKENVSILDADGSPMVGNGKGGLATFDDLVKETMKNFPELFEGSGGGSGTDSKGQRRDAVGGTMTSTEFYALDAKTRAATAAKPGFKLVD